MSTYLRVQTVDLNPEMVSRITAAYEQALHTLCVKDRDDPLTEIVASKIIKLAQTEVLAPAKLRLWRSGNSNALGISCLTRLQLKHSRLRQVGYWATGLRNVRGTPLTPLSPAEAILTVAIMSLTVLVEVALFVLIELF